jgi:hypothetical protein
MQDNEPVLLTAEGKSGKIELTETWVRISEYKKGLMGGWDTSKIDKTHETPRDVIRSARVSPSLDEFYIDFPGNGSDKSVTISFDKSYRPEFENIAEEIVSQRRWYDNNSKLSNTVNYESEEQASRDANRAAKSGWIPQSTSRTKGKFTTTYMRTPEWLASNNIVSQPSVPTHAADQQLKEDPLQKMKQLKEMLDAKLITQDEYDKKKAEILASM